MSAKTPKQSRANLTAIAVSLPITWAHTIVTGIYKSWPMNIGGKPNWTLYHNLPAFVPVLFELTVLFAGHLMSITFFIRCGLFPGNPEVSPDPRTTDDKFLMEIEVSGDVSKVKKMLTKTGATEINLKEI